MTESTPRPNVLLVQRVYEAFAQRDNQAMLDRFADDVELEQSPQVPWGGRYRGHGQALQFFAALASRVSSHVVFDRYIDAGEDIVVLGRSHGTIIATGRPFDVPIAHFWRIQDGRVTQIRFCIDIPTILPAFG